MASGTKKKTFKKIVLAYSGAGLDTSIIIPWLKENYNNCEVIAVSGDVGQGTELDGLEEKAIKTGASKLYVRGSDARNSSTDYIFPTMQGRRGLRGRISAGHVVRAPCDRQAALSKSRCAEGADAICHGCTGKGNDQVRFELAIKAFAPEMAIIAPVARVGHQVPRRGDRLRRGAQYSAEDQPRDELFQGQEPLAPLARGPRPRGSRQRAAVRQARLPGNGRFARSGARQAHLCYRSILRRAFPSRSNGEEDRRGRADRKAERARRRERHRALLDMVENRLVGMKSPRRVRNAGRQPSSTRAHSVLETHLPRQRDTQHYKELVANKLRASWCTTASGSRRCARR